MSENYAVKHFWEALEQTFNDRRKDNPNINMSFNQGQRNLFEQTFKDYYNNIQNRFMTVGTKALDRHKQAAIFLLSAIKAHVIDQQCSKEEMALAQYVISLDVCLSYLTCCINERLSRIGKRISKIELPFAWACGTEYLTILARILYFENDTTEMEGTEKMSYNVLEWSDRFFLLEYITLLQSHIDTRIMKDIYWPD